MFFAYHREDGKQNCCVIGGASEQPKFQRLNFQTTKPGPPLTLPIELPYLPNTICLWMELELSSNGYEVSRKLVELDNTPKNSVFQPSKHSFGRFF